MPIKAIQQFMLGTVLNTEQQARKTLQQVKAAGYDGIELCSFMLHPASFVIKAITKAAGMPVGRGGKLDWHALVREAGLQVVSLHTDLGSLERDAAAVAAQTKSYGARYAVVTGMYRFAYADAAALHALAARLNKAGEALAREGVSLLYHNHNCELLQTGGQTAYALLLKETAPRFVNFEFDSYWFTEGGANALVWMRRLGTRMKLWHINDRGPRSTTGSCMTPILKTDSRELGAGSMELVPMVEQAKTACVDAVILESHRNWAEHSPVKSMKLSAAFLHRHFE